MTYLSTPRKALFIQTWQTVYYRARVGRAAIRELHRRTTLPNSNPDKPLDVEIINRHFPRGGKFEQFPDTGKHDPTAYDWATAYQNGKIYSS